MESMYNVPTLNSLVKTGYKSTVPVNMKWSFFRHELAIQALQTGDQDDNSLIEHKKEQDQNLVIENQMVELGLTQQVGDPTLNFVWQYDPCLLRFFRML